MIGGDWIEPAPPPTLSPPWLHHGADDMTLGLTSLLHLLGLSVRDKMQD